MIAQLVALVLAILLQTQPADVPLADPALEARAQALMREMRCTSCVNEPVSQSTADMAIDARRVIRRQVAAGESDEQVRDYFRTRYGNFVSFRPPSQGWGMLIWAFPFVLLAGGLGVFAWRSAGRRSRALTPEPDDRDRPDA